MKRFLIPLAAFIVLVGFLAVGLSRDPHALIDKAGTIRYKQVGPVTHDVLQDKILPLIRELQK